MHAKEGLLLTQHVMSQLAEMIHQLVEADERNRLSTPDAHRIYDAPLVAVASAGDPLFIQLKLPEVVGAHHMAPSEWLPGAKSVVSYFLPFSEIIRRSNYEQGLPSTEWVSARIDGEAFNNVVRREIYEFIRLTGHHAVVPPHDERYCVRERRSNWSERHVAYIAGLGSFGLNRSLITKRGTAGRFGSVVTDLELCVTPRAAASVYAACPWLDSRECGLCIARCPAGAITEQGKSVPTCAAYIDEQIRPLFAPRYGCAKCQTNVPCESASPQM